MANLNLEKELAALTVVDPYNDFISADGKIWGRIKGMLNPKNMIKRFILFQQTEGVCHDAINRGTAEQPITLNQGNAL